MLLLPRNVIACQLLCHSILTHVLPVVSFLYYTLIYKVAFSIYETVFALLKAVVTQSV
jgi:hypothetical protein